MRPHLLHGHPAVVSVHDREITPSKRARGPGARGLLPSLVGVCILPDAHYLLDLLGQGFLLLRPPPVVLLLPVAGFLLHQLALRYPACLFLKVAVPARVAHRRSPPSLSGASSAFKNGVTRSPRGLNGGPPGGLAGLQGGQGSGVGTRLRRRRLKIRWTSRPT